MNIQQEIEAFINDYNLLLNLNQPCLHDIVSFDFTAFMTAKQIWVQNIKHTSEESQQLRNKSQQLMKVLRNISQYSQMQHQQQPVYEYKLFKNRKVQKKAINNSYSVKELNDQIKKQKQHNDKPSNDNKQIIDNQSNIQTNKQKGRPSSKSFTKSKQVELNIKGNINKQQQRYHNKIQKKQLSLTQIISQNRSKKAIKQTKYWDENIDNSNQNINVYSNLNSQKDLKLNTRQEWHKQSIINELNSQILSEFPEFQRRAQSDFFSTGRIIQLNKIQYKKQSPSWEFIHKNNIQKMQNNKKQKQQFRKKQTNQQNHQQLNMKANCVHIKYQCCCKCNKQGKDQFPDLSKHSHQSKQSMRVNQFKLKSPSVHQKSYMQTEHNQTRKSVGHEKKANKKTQKINNRRKENKIKTQYYNDQNKTSINQNYQQNYYNNQYKFQQAINHNQPTKSLHKQAKPHHKRNKTTVNQKHLNRITKNVIQDQQSVQIIQSRNSPQFQNAQISNQPKVMKINLQTAKNQQKTINQQAIIRAIYEKQRKQEQQKQIRQELIQRIRKQQQQKIENQLEMRKIKQQQQARKTKQFYNAKAKQRQEQKKRQNMLLMRLRQQFSQICYQQPNQDEKRVQQQIKQLEQKLGQIVSNASRVNKVPQPCSPPKAKIVKLNLTPSRSNLYKNSIYNNRSSNSRSPVSQKPSSQLLTKKIQNATKVM